MPELAEVEFYRRQWDAGLGGTITGLELHPSKRVFRGVSVRALVAAVKGARLQESQAHGKQMLFGFSGGAWLGLHLGMTGALRVEAATFTRAKHDHLVLRQAERALVFADARCFGRVRFHCGASEPEWWTRLPPPVLSSEFTLERMVKFVARHGRAPLKAVLLAQAGFPGVGNWMADEILWRARLSPAARAGSLEAQDLKRLWRETRAVCAGALRHVAKEFGDPPKSWLFAQRWKAGGRCPRDGDELQRATVAGRTTAWCAQCQSA